MKRALKKTTTQYFGDLSGVRGDLDDCEITIQDRHRGIDVADLLQN